MKTFDIVPPKAKKKESKTEDSNEFKVNYKSEESDLIDDTNEEILTLKNAFKSKMDKEQELKKKNTDPNFWFAVYFQDSEQKNVFLKKIKANTLTEGLYIDGIQFAKLLGIEIPKKPVKAPGKFKSFNL